MPIAARCVWRHTPRFSGKTQKIGFFYALQVSFYLPRLLPKSCISCCTPTLDEKEDEGKHFHTLWNALLWLCSLL